MKKPKAKCKMCEAEFEQTASNDNFCSRYCVGLHKNKMCNERWLKAKPQKRNPNAANVFAGSAHTVVGLDRYAQFNAVRGL